MVIVCYYTYCFCENAGEKVRRYIQDDHILGATQREIAESLWKVRKQEVKGECWDEVEQDEIQDCSQEKAEI